MNVSLDDLMKVGIFSELLHLTVQLMEPLNQISIFQLLGQTTRNTHRLYALTLMEHSLANLAQMWLENITPKK